MHADKRLDLITNSSRLLVLGTSLATYSAFRLVKQAREQGKEVLIISLGPSRADPLEGVEKMERKAGDVLRVFLDETLKCVLILLHSSVVNNDDGMY